MSLLTSGCLDLEKLLISIDQARIGRRTVQRLTRSKPTVRDLQISQDDSLFRDTWLLELWAWLETFWGVTPISRIAILDVPHPEETKLCPWGTTYVRTATVGYHHLRRSWCRFWSTYFYHTKSCAVIAIGLGRPEWVLKLLQLQRR